MSTVSDDEECAAVPWVVGGVALQEFKSFHAAQVGCVEQCLLSGLTGSHMPIPRLTAFDPELTGCRLQFEADQITVMER
jgi:hypothetical protein